MQKIKSAALALPALLLASCAAALPAENTATIETAAAAAPQTLKVYTSASLAPAAQAYAEAETLRFRGILRLDTMLSCYP